MQKRVLLNTEVIAINQDVTPQGFPAVPGDYTVWSRNLSDGSVRRALQRGGHAEVDRDILRRAGLGRLDQITAHVMTDYM